jgi:GTPase SAR1 family protein
VPKTTFLCPYCYDVSKLNDIQYFCRKCNNTKNIAKKGSSIFQPFAAPLSTICPDCGTSAVAVCPICHRKLPEGTLTGTNSIISVVGTRGSGKSHFVGVIINELYKRIAADFGAMFVGFDQSHSLWERDFGSLYNSLQALELTQVGERKDPLIYEMIFGTKFGANKMYTFAFFDTAGENFNDEDQMSVLNKYIYQSSGIIFLFDPLQIPSVEGKISQEVAEGSSSGASRVQNTEVLTHVSNLIRNYHGMKKTEKIKTPVAIVFTKLDAIRDILPESSTILDNSPHYGEVVLNDLHNVNLEVQALLAEWGEASFIRQVEIEYAKSAFFAVSALGFDNHPDAHNDRKINKPQPHRIEDPFLWLLTETGVLKGKK